LDFTFDRLTGLQTRQHLQTHLACDSEVAWVIRVDLDSFIFANDHLGYTEGDKALLSVANALDSLSKKYDGTAFRVGGDDFVLVLPHMLAANLQRTLRDLQHSLALSDYSFGDHPYRPADALSASFLAVSRERLREIPTATLLAHLDDLFYAERASTVPLSTRKDVGRSTAKRGFVTIFAGDT